MSLVRVLLPAYISHLILSIGWVLLALAVALANASAGITALWVLLASTGDMQLEHILDHD